jgi:D-arabinan exo alpha-(1,3)/(1,5)-arabinofuranosidase (non-reducing end)
MLKDLLTALTITTVLLLSPSACTPPPEQGSAEEEPVRDLTYFLERLHQLAQLPRLERSHTSMQSTWDRTGGNADGDDFKRIEGDRNVLLDMSGPGCIHRIYTGLIGAHFKQTRIQIYIDKATKPLFDLPVNDFFSELVGPFPPPLTAARTLPGTHFPIPYAKHVRVQLTSAPGPKERWGVYWQLTYTSYPAQARVESLSWPPDARAQQELARVVGAWRVAKQLPAPPPERWQVDRSLPLGPGAQQTVSLADSGVIRQLRLRVTPATPAALRALRLRISWDGATAQSVDLPAGYLFGHGDTVDLKAAGFSSLLLGVADGEAVARFPMPFSQGAEITLENTAAAGAITARLRLDVDPLPPDGAALGRFHATWSQRRAAVSTAPTFGPSKVPGHVVLEREGVRGKYVGALVHLQWPHQWAWWGEGDWLVWSDERDWPPSYHGTGYEEYFNSGWTLFERRPVSGFVTVRPGPVAVYSFHLNDAFNFEQRIKVVAETVGSFGGQQVIDEGKTLWGTTAYWYALPAQPAGSTSLAD